MITGIFTIICWVGLGIAIGLAIRFYRDQQQTNDLIDSDVRAMENCYKALMDDFTNYQVQCDRELEKLEKQLEIKSNNAERRMDKMNKSLPSIIRNVVGHIEFAQPLDKK